MGETVLVGSSYQLYPFETERSPGFISTRWDLVMLITIVCSNSFEDSAERSPSSYFLVLTLVVLCSRLKIFVPDFHYPALTNTFPCVIRTDVQGPLCA